MYLKHHGVKGMKWGVRKDNSRSSSKTVYKTGNLDKFGQGHHNALFVTGLSGSGKSTFTIDLAKKTNSEVIHLDSYFEKGGIGNNKNFNKFLKDNGVTKSTMFKKDGKLDYAVSDKILPLIKQYKKKIVVEGVQVMDTTLSDKTRELLKSEPVISLQTSKTISVNRATNRDEVNESNIKTLIDRAEKTFKIKSEMEKELNLTIGEFYVNEYKLMSIK